VKTFSHTEFKDVNVDYTDDKTNCEKKTKGNYKYEKKNQTLSAVDAGGIYVYICIYIFIYIYICICIYMYIYI
jgi:hypothetical protein